MLESNKIIYDRLPDEKERVERLRHNQLLEAAGVGDKPFDTEFYETAHMPRALERASNVIVIFGDHLGDAILSVPVITSLKRYIEMNGIEGKRVTLISSQPELFESLRTVYPELNIISKAQPFEAGQDGETFCFNLDRKFGDYERLGMKDDDEQDPMKVFFHDCQDWVKDEIPVTPGTVKKYDAMPLRIARNMEMLLGQKLYEDINAVREFIPKGEAFESQKKELMQRFNLHEGRPLVVISPGSTVKGKEYPPESWETVLRELCSHRPDVEVLFIDDPDEGKRTLYGEMVDRLRGTEPYDIRRGSASLRDMNTLMHMARLCISPDTGLGHYASMCGTPNVMFGLTNSVFWSGPNTYRVTHPYGRGMIRSGALVDLSPKDHAESYAYGETGEKRGAIDIDPVRVASRALQILG